MVSLARLPMGAALVALLLMTACRETAPFTHSGLHADDRLEWQLTAAVPELIVRCPAGIGSVALTRRNMAARELIVELHLPGLENFTVENHDTRYRLEVTREQRVIAEPQTGNPISLLTVPTDTAGGPWRMRIDLQAFSAHSDAITLSWVDFYR